MDNKIVSDEAYECAIGLLEHLNKANTPVEHGVSGLVFAIASTAANLKAISGDDLIIQEVLNELQRIYGILVCHQEGKCACCGDDLEDDTE